MPRPPSRQPTEGELEILKVLWDEGPQELGGVRAALQRLRPAAPSTVATMLKVMLDKELVRRDDGPRGYVWSARVSRESAARGLIGNLLDRLFDGSARRMVAHLLEEESLSDQDRAAIRRLMDEHDRKAGPGGRGN